MHGTLKCRVLGFTKTRFEIQGNAFEGFMFAAGLSCGVFISSRSRQRFETTISVNPRMTTPASPPNVISHDPYKKFKNPLISLEQSIQHGGSP
jgi:hypothetical protein